VDLETGVEEQENKKSSQKNAPAPRFSSAAFFSLITANLRAKHVYIIAVNALLLLAFIACLAASGSIRGTLRSQQAAKAWAGQSGERFAQLSAFIQDGLSFSEETRYYLRSSIDSSLVAASIEGGEGRILYTDAWSAEGEVFVAGARGSASVKAFGVGGDFFLFHPMKLMDGSYLSPDDIMKDRVVLDEELAWRLFGSFNVAGLEVMVGDRLHIIAGVVSRESDFASSRAYTYGAGIFISYESLIEQTGESARISCYEIVMPDPITGFAYKTFSEAFPDKNAHIVENSARYSLSNIFGAIGDFGERSIRGDGMVYPYWENAARYTEDWLALLLVLSLIFISCPIVFGVVYIIKAARFLSKRGRSAVTKMIDERDKREAEQYLLDHAEEFADYDIDDIIREVREYRE